MKPSISPSPPPIGSHFALATDYLAAIVADAGQKTENRLAAARTLLSCSSARPGTRVPPAQAAADAIAKASAYAVPPSPPGPHLRAVGDDT